MSKLCLVPTQVKVAFDCKSQNDYFCYSLYLQSGQDDEKSHPPNGSLLQNGKDLQSNIGNSSSPRRIIAFVGGIDLTGKSP